MIDAFYIDTFLYSKHHIWLLDQHIQRLQWAAESEHLKFDNQYILKTYNALTQTLDSSDYIIRVTWNLYDLTYTHEIKPLDVLSSPINLTLATTAKLDKDPYKKNDRSYWLNQTAHINLNTHDIVSFNSEGHIIETSRFNIFILKGNMCVTPYLDSGCVNGCYRQHVLQKGFIIINSIKYPLVEDHITLDDLKAYPIYLGNSVRGLLPAQFIK